MARIIKSESIRLASGAAAVLSAAELADPALWERVRDSMTRW